MGKEIKRLGYEILTKESDPMFCEICGEPTLLLLDGTYQDMCDCSELAHIRYELGKVEARLEYLKQQLDRLEPKIKKKNSAYFYNSHVDILGEDEK